MSKIVCVYPTDDTTDFLGPITDVLKAQGAIIIRGDTTEEGHRKEIADQIKELTEQDIFVFMGHGTSYCLYGTPQSDEDQPLFGDKRLAIPKCHGSLLISCRSSEFIKSQRLVNSIGFGEIPATWEEILRLRNENSNCYSGIDKDTIPTYQDSFIKALCKALQLWDPSSQTLRQLYQNIQLCITGQIVRHLLDKESLLLKQRQGLFEMLYELKQETDFRES